ncbi:MAG: TetR/AcrR family transcriptional regulator C-terminal domain-containing protein [Eggerthellaceae bacterium]|nr:TetR/AcrR family transcriptional regulator C-terminal domain-containing protein [Eggerthellaceae bacterium]
MAVRDTKRMFADELEAMMARMPLSKVRVGDLCTRCGVERRVFYYHFKDKYDLVAWMFEQDHRAASEFGAPYSEALYAEAHHRLWARRAFYKRAFEEDSQNSIYRYLLQFSIEANEVALKRYLGVPKLAREYVFAARHFAHGNIGCLVDWLRGEIDATPAQLAACMFSCMPEALRDAYESQAGLAEAARGKAATRG